jgi:hypothetical protein
MVERPPTEAEWTLDGFNRGGHTVAETLAYASWCADWEDE